MELKFGAHKPNSTRRRRGLILAAPLAALALSLTGACTAQGDTPPSHSAYGDDSGDSTLSGDDTLAQHLASACSGNPVTYVDVMNIEFPASGFNACQGKTFQGEVDMMNATNFDSLGSATPDEQSRIKSAENTADWTTMHNIEDQVERRTLESLPDDAPGVDFSHITFNSEMRPGPEWSPGPFPTEFDIMNGHFVNLDLSDATVPHLNLMNGLLKNPKFINTKMPGVSLMNAIMIRPDFDHAVLDGGTLNNADLSSALHLDTASLQGAKYNDNTKFPAGFDPKAHGMVHSDYTGSASVEGATAPDGTVLHN